MSGCDRVLRPPVAFSAAETGCFLAAEALSRALTDRPSAQKESRADVCACSMFPITRLPQAVGLMAQESTIQSLVVSILGRRGGYFHSSRVRRWKYPTMRRREGQVVALKSSTAVRSPKYLAGALNTDRHDDESADIECRTRVGCLSGQCLFSPPPSPACHLRGGLLVSTVWAFELCGNRCLSISASLTVHPPCCEAAGRQAPPTYAWSLRKSLMRWYHLASRPATISSHQQQVAFIQGPSSRAKGKRSGDERKCKSRG
jgi:hypothetical protein